MWCLTGSRHASLSQSVRTRDESNFFLIETKMIKKKVKGPNWLEGVNSLI
jgi:hypothetical protein